MFTGLTGHPPRGQSRRPADPAWQFDEAPPLPGNFALALQTDESSAAIQAALAQCDAARDLAPVSLSVERDQHLVLSSDTADASAVTPLMLTTSDVDLFKRWIGVPDESCRAHEATHRYWPLPTRQWSGRKVSSRLDFTAEEAVDIERAGRVYLFGDSALVRDYRDVIGLYHGTFEAAIYAMNELSVMPGARLSVVGAPAVLLCSKFDLHAPGQLVLHTPCHAHFGSVRKFSGAQSLN
jgi:hypothetical protein